jgi:uncharacterized protein (TIGR00725 family)
MAEPRRHRLVGVIGAGQASATGLAWARELGRLLAQGGATIVCGGLGGIMEAVCQGASESGGETIGLLPGGEAREANPYVTLPIPTNLGHGRNVLIAHTAEVLVAVEGEYGTLSEIALGLKLGKPVFSFDSWPGVPGLQPVATPQEAAAKVLALLAAKGDSCRQI